jgi:hypothetical protein
MSVPTAAASVSSGAAAAAAAAARKLPLFFAYCPDAPDALAKRLEVRPRHWERWQRDKERGLGCEWGVGRGKWGMVVGLHMVWSGLVWSGLVWSGLVWSGLVWSGLVWS